MGRQSQEEVAAAAKRRLELLRRELDRAGVQRMDDESLAEGDVDRFAADPFAADLPRRHLPWGAGPGGTRGRTAGRSPAGRSFRRGCAGFRRWGSGRSSSWWPWSLPQPS